MSKKKNINTQLPPKKSIISKGGKRNKHLNVSDSDLLSLIDIEIVDSVIWTYFAYICAFIKFKYEGEEINKKEKMQFENLFISVLSISKTCCRSYYKVISLYLKKHKMNLNTSKNIIKYFSKLRKVLEREVSVCKKRTVVVKLKSFNIEKKINNIVDLAKKQNVTVRNPSIWGDKVWNLLHLMSFLEAKMTSHQLRSNTLQIIANLPCTICKNHTFDFLKEHNFGDLEKEHYKFYFIQFRNYVKMNHSDSIRKHKVTLEGINKQLQQMKRTELYDL